MTAAPPDITAADLEHLDDVIASYLEDQDYAPSFEEYRANAINFFPRLVAAVRARDAELADVQMRHDFMLGDFEAAMMWKERATLAEADNAKLRAALIEQRSRLQIIRQWVKNPSTVPGADDENGIDGNLEGAVRYECSHGSGLIDAALATDEREGGGDGPR